MVKYNQPCKDCGSSDALTYYDDHSYCFSCNTYLHSNTYERIGVVKGDSSNDRDYVSNMNTYEYTMHRGITKETMKAYGVLTKHEDGKPMSSAFPFGSQTQVRSLEAKSFTTIGNSDEVQLFGQSVFSAAMARSITITEGALDSLSAYQMLGSKYPTVSVRSASTARKDCERARAYLNSFERLYICFDSDEVGERAAKEVAALFDVNKVYHVKLTRFKDANEYLQAGAQDEFVKVWWSSKKFMPKGIISSHVEVEEALKKESQQASASYPFSTLDAMAYGIRQGELVLFTALEKVGKTEVLRAVEYHLLKNTDSNIGIIHLEESEKRSIQGLVSYELNTPCHLPDSSVSVSEQLEAFKRISKDGRTHFYTHFGSDDPNTILDTIRYLVGVCHCRYIFLDHITMLVTGFEDEDERKKLDYISTRLAMMTRELNFTLFLVSHVNDNGQTRGSRNIAKVADLIIHLDRDIEASDTTTRNTTRLNCRGNRFAGTTGPAGQLVFDPKTYTVSEMKQPEVFDYNV